MERNQNYWNKGLPYLDGIEFYNALPFSPELGSALLSGRIDYARIMDPVSVRKAQATPICRRRQFYQSVIQATWVNAKRKPFDDPRVRRACTWCWTRSAGGGGEGCFADDGRRLYLPVLGFRHAARTSWSSALGYQADPSAAVKEAKALMAAAGQGAASAASTSLSAMSPASSSGPRPSRRCCRRR